MYYYEHTKYPQLYKNTYWGKFQSNSNPKIIENRNNFVKKFNIQECITKIPQYISKIIDETRLYITLDHLECYRTTDKQIIIVSSPYSDTISQDYIKCGWISIEMLYNEAAITYIKYVPMRIKRNRE